MIPAVERIHARISEINSSFDKLGFNKAPKSPSIDHKPFSEFLKDTNTTSNIDKQSSVEINTMNQLSINNETAKNDDIFSNISRANAGKLNDILMSAYTVDMLNDNQKLGFIGVDSTINEFSKKAEHFPTKYDDIIKEASNKYDVPETLIKALIKQESNYNPDAVSHKGATGLMQLMPTTAKELGLSENQLKDPYSNIMAGMFYV